MCLLSLLIETPNGSKQEDEHGHNRQKELTSGTSFLPKIWNVFEMRCSRLCTAILRFKHNAKDRMSCPHVAKNTLQHVSDYSLCTGPNMREDRTDHCDIGGANNDCIDVLDE